MWMDRDPFERRFNSLIQLRKPWEPVWKDIQKYVCPMRGNFIDQPNRGDKIDHITLLDSTPVIVARTLAAGMLSGLTSPSRPWFHLGVSDPDLNDYQPVKVWLEDVEEILYSIFSKSNIYSGLHNIYEELANYGVGALGVFEDFDRVVSSKWYTCGEYYFAVGPDGLINTFGRTFFLSVENLIKRFGKENVSLSTRNLYDNHKVDEWIKVYHLIEPNDNRIANKYDSENLPYRSVYWEDGSEKDKVLRYKGYHEFPVLGPRWGPRSITEIYAQGAPGHLALGDSKGLQKLQFDYYKGLDKIVDPPVQVPADMDNDIVDSLPGGVSYYPNGTNTPIKELYQVPPNFLGPTDLKIDKVQMMISKIFYYDLFRMISGVDNPQMTAREVIERHEEKMVMLGPVIERQEAELLDPMLIRVFNIAERAGIIPRPPKIMENMDLKIEYISILAQAQKMVGTAAIEQFAGFVGNLAGAKPEVLDKANMDEMVDRYGDMLGVPPQIVNSDEEVTRIREERIKAQQQMEAMQNSMAAVQGAKVLSETRTDENNALAALLGAGGAG